jgi:hypothetical protein
MVKPLDTRVKNKRDGMDDPPIGNTRKFYSFHATGEAKEILRRMAPAKDSNHDLSCNIVLGTQP